MFQPSTIIYTVYLYYSEITPSQHSMLVYMLLKYTDLRPLQVGRLLNISGRKVKAAMDAAGGLNPMDAATIEATLGVPEGSRDGY